MKKNIELLLQRNYGSEQLNVKFNFEIDAEDTKKAQEQIDISLKEINFLIESQYKNTINRSEIEREYTTKFQTEDAKNKLSKLNEFVELQNAQDKLQEAIGKNRIDIAKDRIDGINNKAELQTIRDYVSSKVNEANQTNNKKNK